MTKQMTKTLADLRVQAMLFDMAVDLEAATLVPKPALSPKWLTRWKDKINDDSDNLPESPENAGW